MPNITTFDPSQRYILFPIFVTTEDDEPLYVSHFDKSWGIKALIGLNFFRRFRVTVDYKAGHLVTEPL